MLTYKIIKPTLTSIRLAISDDKTITNLNPDYEKESFQDIINSLNKYLIFSNNEYGIWANNQGDKNRYKDSIFNIAGLLQIIDIPQYYKPFQKYNFFNNLLGSFLQCINVQSSTEKADRTELEIVKISSKLLFILSYYHDCCEFLGGIGFFDVITQFLSFKNSKYRKAPKINEEYSDFLIKTFANFAAYQEFHEKFTPPMFSYAINAFRQSKTAQFYEAPLSFFCNFFYYCKILPNFFKSYLLDDIVRVIGSYPCGDNFEKNQTDQKYQDLIRNMSSIIIYTLVRMECMPIRSFFESKIHIFIKKYYLTYTHLMGTIEYFSIKYQPYFNNLEISLDDICKGFDNNDQSYLQCTFLSIYNVLVHSPNRGEMLSSNLIPRIADFIFHQYDKYDYSTKLYSLTLLCYIYSEVSSLYIQNINIVLFLLENCCMFISESEEQSNIQINRIILTFLGVFHSFLEKCGNINEFPVLASSFNRCMEVISNSSENFDESLIQSLTPFDIPMNSNA